MSKILAAIEQCNANTGNQLHGDETSFRHNCLVNCVISIMDSDGRLRMIHFSGSIIAKDGTVEKQSCTVIASFNVVNC